MKRVKRIQAVAALLALVGIVCPPNLWAAQPARSGAVIKDVALQRGGVLQGAAVNVQGAPLKHAPVLCLQNGQLVKRTQSDAEGRFQFAQLRGGVYEIRTATGGGVYRAWAVRTAPPSANNSILLVDGQQSERGQLLSVLSNPLVLLGLVAIAIAVPLALDNNKKS